MNVSNPVPSAIKTDSGAVIHTKVIDIPPWDLTSAVSVEVPITGIALKDIIAINGHIIDDNLSEWIVVPGNSMTLAAGNRDFTITYNTANPNSIFVVISAVTVLSNWNDTSINRGILTITYIPT